jgi:hypothetical protein
VLRRGAGHRRGGQRPAPVRYRARGSGPGCPATCGESPHPPPGRHGVALPRSFTLCVLVLRIFVSLGLRRSAWRAEGAPLMIVKKVLTAPRSRALLVTVGDCFLALSDKRHRAGFLTHGYSGQSNLAQMVRVVWSPSMPHSSATARTMSSPWCRVGSIIPWFQGPPSSSTSIRA